MASQDANLAMKAISQANGQFTFDLYKVLAPESGNLFFSPISVQVLLALVFFGAKGDTAKQIAKGLRLPDEEKVIEDGFNVIMHQLKDSNDITLDIANRIYLKNGFHIKQQFNQTAIKFLAGVEEVDFAEEEKARKIINGWVEQQTNEKIKDIIPSGFLNGLTRLVLVNAIYFKGDWMKQFIKSRTRPTPFRLTSENVKNVDMMYTGGHFMYTEVADLNSQILLLPYKGRRLNMMIILPREVNGLEVLEKNVANINLRDILDNVYEREVNVYLPKFKLEYEKEITETLRNLGMTAMFDQSAANLSGISDEPLVVSKALHKAYIEVNEEGTEAAAATAFLEEKIDSIGPKPPKPITFMADHPFMFFILEEHTWAVLFAGRYAGPPDLSPNEAAAFAANFPEHLFAWGAAPVDNRRFVAARPFQSGPPLPVPYTGL